MITQQTNYLALAQSRNLEQYKDKPRFNALLASWTQEVQAVENSLWQIYADRLIQNALSVLPLTITVSTAGAIGTMQFTYSANGGPTLGPIVSASDGNWNLPGTPFFVRFVPVVHFTVGWNYVIDAKGVTTPTFGGMATDVLIGGALISAGPPAVYATPSGMLAQIGNMLGQQSNGLNDALFFFEIQARIKVNNSTGLRQELLDVVLLLWGTYTGIIWSQDYYPATYFMVPGQLGLGISPYIIVQQFLDEMVGGGIALAFLWTLSQADTIIGGSIYAPGFAAGPPTSNTGATAAQSPGSIYFAGFTAGPPMTNTGGGVLAGVVQNGGY